MSDETRLGGSVRRRAFLRASGAAGATAVAGCLGSSDDGDDTVTIGALQPLSGPFTAWGQAHQAGLEFAVEELNEDGGILGHEVVIESTDTGSDAGEADTQFRRFVESEDAIAVTGPVSSDVGLRTRRTAEELAVPLVLHMAGSHRILPKETRYAFRMGSQPAMTDIRPQVEIVEERGYEKVGAILADYEWGHSMAASIETAFPDDVDVHTAMAPVGEDDFTPFIRDMPEDIDMMIATGHPPGSISIHAQTLELAHDPDLTTGAGFPPAVIHSGLGEQAQSFNHLHVSDPTDEQFQDVAQRFADARDGRFDTHEAYGYVTAKLVAQAAENADSTDPEAVADAIRTIEFDTVFANPIKYTEWGELDDLVHILSSVEAGAPEYADEGEWHLAETFRSSPIPGFDPDEFDLE